MKNNNTKFIGLLLFFTIIAPLSYCVEVSEREMKTFLEAIKEKKDVELIIASEQFKECSTQFSDFRLESSDPQKKQKFKECLETKILSSDDPEGSDAKLLEIAKSLGLSSFNVEAAESSKSIMEYLQKRIKTAIYGKEDSKEKLQKLKEQNYTDHDVYYQLYSEQIGKNTLLEVAKYCLENFGTNDKQEFIFFENAINAEGKNVRSSGLICNPIQKKTVLKSPPKIDEMPFEDVFELKPDINDPNNCTVKNKTFDWKNKQDIHEYEVCTLKNKLECDKRFNDSKYRDLHTIRLLKEAEFELSSNDPEKKIIKHRYGFCAGEVIKNMCEIYRCNNVYTTGTPEEERKRCKKEFNIDVTQKHQSFKAPDKNDQFKEGDLFKERENESGKQKGAIACNLITRLEEYRTVLKAIEGINKDENAGDKVSLDGPASEYGFKGEFDPRKIDKLTSISSTELTDKVSSLKDSEKNAEKIKEECMEEVSGINGNPSSLVLKKDAKDDSNCTMLMAKLDDVKLETITLDTETKTIAKLKELESINSPDEIKKFLKENNLSQFEGRLSDIADDEAKMTEIKNLISQNFNSKRLALIDRLKEKFKKESQIKTFQGDNSSQAQTNIDIENEIANQTIADISTHKKRIENLFEYSNIVSSYLEVKDSEENIVGQNATGRVQEVADAKEGSSLKQYFSGAEDENISSDEGGSIGYLSAIEQFITFDTKED